MGVPCCNADRHGRGRVEHFPDNAGLLSERYRGLIQKGQPLWDRILVILLVVSYIGQIIFIPLDVFRFHFMLRPGPLVSFFGLALFVGGWWILTLAMKVNPFAVPAVRSVFEERFLKRELEGYKAYTQKVRYRLIPYVW